MDAHPWRRRQHLPHVPGLHYQGGGGPGKLFWGGPGKPEGGGGTLCEEEGKGLGEALEGLEARPAIARSLRLSASWEVRVGPSRPPRSKSSLVGSWTVPAGVACTPATASSYFDLSTSTAWINLAENSLSRSTRELIIPVLSLLAMLTSMAMFDSFSVFFLSSCALIVSCWSLSNLSFNILTSFSLFSFSLCNLCCSSKDNSVSFTSFCWALLNWDWVESRLPDLTVWGGDH